MRKNIETLLKKLDQPPAGHNFARSNYPSMRRTTNALVNLALGFPTISYRWCLDAIQAQLGDRLNNQCARALLERNCPASQLDHNIELLTAFQDYNDVRQFDGLRVFPEFCGNYMASPEVGVPIRPTALLRENGAIKPLFVIGWASSNLDYYQRRLLASMYEDAIYSLTDLRASEGEVLLFPRNGYRQRKVDRWLRGDYQLLSRDEMQEQSERFIRSRSAARLLIPERMKEQDERRQQKAAARTAQTPPRPNPKP